MTRAEVVDASAVVAMVFAEPGAGALVRHVGCRLLAPTMMPHEMAHALWTKVGWGLEQRVALFEQFRDFMGLQHGLTDASYLWFAIDRKAGLVTLDRQMARVASLVLSQ